MLLSELLGFDDIVIQCHDNPDADALASGFAMYWYLEKMGKKPRFIYRGLHEVTKNNLLIMIDKLEIPVSYVPDFDEKPELLITVDCQYGQKNVTTGAYENLAIIDHHQITVELPELSEVRINLGSCATVIWDMLRFEGLDVNEDTRLATALYYGLYTDTNRLTEVSHPLDRDMQDSLVVNKTVIKEMTTSNISLDELKITGRAILEYEYFDKYRYLIIQAEPCDPTILGVISDFSMETTGVDVCLAYYVSPQEIKFSVRTCTNEVHANELASELAAGLGGGGGHLTKAGGAIRPEKLGCDNAEEIRDKVRGIFIKRMDDYFDKYKIIYAKDTTLDTSDMKRYEKKPQHLGYVKLTDLFPINSIVEIRTLEGDVNIRLDADKYLMIGIEGEIYPITKEKLESSYMRINEPYSRTFEYTPCVTDVYSGEKKNVLAYAKSVVSTGITHIYAKPLDRYVKLFTAWDEEKYYSGVPGDYIAVREDDPHDIYIISGHLFDELYKEV